MVSTILIDQDIKGHGLFLELGWRETGWEQLLPLEFKLLSDVGLPPNCPDQDIWRFVQQQGFLLITGNRNREDETSLQATIERENRPESLPMLTVSHKESLLLAEYRQQVAHGLADVLLYLTDYRGAGRVFVP
jgi:hypothetical protein